MTTKVCKSCQAEKPLSEFGRNRGQPDRRSVRCLVCIEAEKVPAGDLCVKCGQRPRQSDRTTCHKCDYDKFRDNKLDRRRKAWDARRVRILQAYGGKCVICGENDTDVLLLDHINDDGAEHRARVGNDKVYKDLEKQGFPPIVQVLCGNDDLRKRRGRFGSSGT